MSLPAEPLLLTFPPAVKSVGVAVGDHEQVIRALSGLGVDGLPERAVAKRRAEFLAGRFAALSALQKLGAFEAPGRHDDGSPRWPREVVGSITHGAGRALCAVALSRELRSLGIDAESLLKPSYSVELQRRICSDDELALLDARLGLPPHVLVTLAFSAKESLYKCLYPLVGRFMDFHAARVVASAGPLALDQTDFTLELAIDWSEQFPAGSRLTARAGVGADHVETAVLLPA